MLLIVAMSFRKLGANSPKFDTASLLRSRPTIRLISKTNNRPFGQEAPRHHNNAFAAFASNPLIA